MASPARRSARLASLLALMVALVCNASGARDVSHALEGGRLQSGAASLHSAKAHRRSYDQDWKPTTPEEIEANLEEIRSVLLEAEAVDNYNLRQQGLLVADEEADNKLLAETDPEAFCKTRKYRKRMLKLLKDAPFIGLFNDLRNITRFEGSSITFAKGSYYVVFDSLRTIGRVGLQFQFRGQENLLIPEDAEEAESQFEGLQYMPASDSFVAVRESFSHERHGLVPLTEEIVLNEDGTQWTVNDVCPVKFYGLEDVNKGWEGLHYFERGSDRFLLGLCESNYCKTILGPDPPGLQRGNGRLILTKYSLNKHPGKNNDSDACHWEVLKEIKLPYEAHFLDYAGIAFWPHPFGREVSVVSQEDAAVYLGEFDWDAMEFVPGGQVYFFPRDDDCKKIFCNVEGLTFLDRRRMLFASDRSKPIQGFECMTRDQSVHIMALP